MPVPDIEYVATPAVCVKTKIILVVVTYAAYVVVNVPGLAAAPLHCDATG
jgi:hypothetical protein